MFQEIKKEIESFGFFVVSHDFERPWGGFLVIDETQAQEFSNKFFERPICDQMGITLVDGLGDKIQSSSWLLKK